MHFNCRMGIHISSVYSPFSDRAGIPLHNIPSPEVLMKSFGAELLRPDALPDVNHIHQTDTACSWLVCHSRGDCAICITYLASPEARPSSFFGKPSVRPRSMLSASPHTHSLHSRPNTTYTSRLSPHIPITQTSIRRPPPQQHSPQLLTSPHSHTPTHETNKRPPKQNTKR